MFMIRTKGVMVHTIIERMFYMSKSILGYFKSENDAEVARSKLRVLQVKNLYVDQMPVENYNDAFTPVMSGDINAFNRSSAIGGMAAINQRNNGDAIFLETNDHIKYLIQGQVADETFVKALKIIKEANGSLE